MKKIRILALVLIAALALSGCLKGAGDTDTPTTIDIVQIDTANDANVIGETTQDAVTDIGGNEEFIPDDVLDWEDDETTGAPAAETKPSLPSSVSDYDTFDWNSIPDYMGTDVIEINGDKPMFTEEEKQFAGTYINLSELDSLGRCGVAMGCLGQETRATEERGDISEVHPSGWKQKQFGSTYLYNRSHLLMYALTGLNADERNLITGTEYFNQTLMLGYESMALWVVDNMNAHVVYRVTPVFDGNNLVAKGVLMEAYCIEYPEDCEFCVFVYNIEPGVKIDYATGESWEA